MARSLNLRDKSSLKGNVASSHSGSNTTLYVNFACSTSASTFN